MVIGKILSICALAAGAAILCFGFSEGKTKMMAAGVFLGVFGGILYFTVF